MSKMGEQQNPLKLRRAYINTANDYTSKTKNNKNILLITLIPVKMLC